MKVDFTSLYIHNWPIALTMFFGSFIAGASSQGGGAFAFPVLTLIMDVMPADARNFSFGIQTFGMTSASVLILSKQIKILRNIIIPVSIAGIIGVLIGTYTIVPVLFAAETKLFFVSLWISFGYVLWLVNRSKKRFILADLPPLGRIGRTLLIVFGIVGGMVSAILGNGIDVIVFTFLTLFFGIDEKIATPTSVVLMGVNTVFGFILHKFIIQDITPEVFDYIITAIPVAMIMAPLGAYVISKWSRVHINLLLYLIIIAQFIVAIVVIQPTIGQVVFMGLVMLSGFVLFYLLFHFGLWHARENNFHPHHRK